jgi:FkbM family methyltransferase
MALLGSLRFYSGLSRALGPGAAAGIAIRRKLGMKGEMTAKWKGRPLILRPCESDPTLVSLILGDGEYSMKDNVVEALRTLSRQWRAEGTTPVIVDGGANVGYASAYFAATFPEAVVVAVEPSAASFDLLKRNSASFPQIRPVYGALWSGDKGVSLVSEKDESWGDHVEAGGTVPSMRLEDLIAGVPNGRALIIKLDIEGAEREVCEASGEALRSSPCVVIEPHDWLKPGGGCLSPLYAALQGREMDTFVIGENIVVVDSALVRTGRLAEPAVAERPQLAAVN